MTIPLVQHPDVKAERQKIIQAMANPANRAVLDQFFWWRIRRDAQGYRLRAGGDGAGSVGAEKGEYYLANMALQGGGVLGLAHAGLIYGLELAGVRFAGLAGTSAGSIVVMGLVGLRGEDITQEVGEKLGDLVNSLPLPEFIDGPRPIRIAIKRMLARRNLLGPGNWLPLMAMLRRLLASRGLNSGMRFEAWMHELLSEYGLARIEELNMRLDRLASALARAPVTGGDNPFCSHNRRADVSGNDMLRIITVAMPTGIKLCLPSHLSLLDDEYHDLSPALIVRMSMSIPVFFDPFVMRTAKDEWEKHIRRDLSPFLSEPELRRFEELRELAFLDGGLFSNLATDELVSRMGDVPTISVTLVGDGRRPDIHRRSSLRAAIKDAASVAQSMRLQRDRDAFRRMSRARADWDLSQHQQATTQGTAPSRLRRFPQAVAKIDTGNANWLNFNMSSDERLQLFLTGMVRARVLIENGRFDDDNLDSTERNAA